VIQEPTRQAKRGGDRRQAVSRRRRRRTPLQQTSPHRTLLMFIVFKKDYLSHKAGAQVDVEPQVAKQLIEQGYAEVVTEDPLAPLLARSMEGLLANLNKSMSESLDAALKEFASATVKSRKNQVRALFGDGPGGDPKKTFGRFLIAVRSKDHKTLEE